MSVNMFLKVFKLMIMLAKMSSRYENCEYFKFRRQNTWMTCQLVINQ